MPSSFLRRPIGSPSLTYMKSQKYSSYTKNFERNAKKCPKNAMETEESQFNRIKILLSESVIQLNMLDLRKITHVNNNTGNPPIRVIIALER